ncbi:MAG: LamG-like jellyroll fold domain-containing protein [Thermoguttaceae bacterium]|jgi:hypothetical protein|nr:LamG-like jellyroll fold domain-containing protein [Thermoguttaceae bacterium]
MVRTYWLTTLIAAAIVAAAEANCANAALVGLWRFDEGITSGGTAWPTAYDASGHTLHGTLTALSGSVIPQRIDGSPGSPSATGTATGALRFGADIGGNNQLNRVSILYKNVFDDILNSPAATGQITFAAWVSSEQANEVADKTVYGRIVQRSNWYYYLDALNTIDSFGGNFTNPAFGMFDLTQTALPVSPDSSTSPTWTHTALTFDGEWARFYRDASLVHSIDLRSPPRAIASQGTAGMSIGGEGGGTRQVVGALDDVAIFNKALGQAEIAQIMAGDFTGFLSPSANAVSALQPSHYYRFFEDGGVQASDSGFAAAKRPGMMQFNTPSTFNVAGPGPDDGLLGFLGTNSAYSPDGLPSSGTPRALDLGPGSNFAAEQMTVSMWIKAPEGKAYAWDRLFTNNQTTANNNFTIVMTEATDYGNVWGLWLATGTGNGDAKFLPKTTLDLADGNWHYIFAVREGDNRNFKLMIDGVDYTTKLENPSVQNLGTEGSNAWIGGRTSTAVVFDGMIDEPAIWVGQALTVHQGRALYFAAKPDPYAAAVNDLRPSHYYRFDEDGGLRASDGGFGGPNRPGIMTTIGSATLDTAGPRPGSGFVGFWDTNSAFYPNGSRAMDLGDSSQFAADAMTVAMWFQAPSDRTYTWNRLFTNNRTRANDGFAVALTDAAGHEGLWIATGDTTADAWMLPTATLNLSDDKWHMLVAIRDGDKPEDIKLVVDGVDVTGDLIGGNNNLSIQGTGGAWIGGASSGTYGVFNGRMDDVAIWVGTALTVDQAIGLYLAAIPEPGTPLLAVMAVLGLLTVRRRRIRGTA